MKRLIGTVGAVLLLALAAAACGGETPVEPAAVVSDPLPTADPSADQPPIAGACLPEEPDCEDTLVVGDNPPIPVPPPSGMLVGEGLSVSEALASDATGVLAVHGFLVDNGSEARLCELLAESLPPQCGGATVVVSGYPLDELDLSRAQGVSWTDDLVVIFGEIVDGTLVADPTVSG